MRSEWVGTGVGIPGVYYTCLCCGQAGPGTEEYRVEHRACATPVGVKRAELQVKLAYVAHGREPRRHGKQKLVYDQAVALDRELREMEAAADAGC